jgi:uncharacterized membrane protein
VSTQLPYALTNGAVSAAAFVAAGHTESVLVLPAAVALSVVSLVVLSRRGRERVGT